MENTTATLGLDVLFNNNGAQLAAKITGVNKDGTVSLHVFPADASALLHLSNVAQGTADGSWTPMPVAAADQTVNENAGAGQNRAQQ